MRTAWIDNAKAIAILLVVFGHTAGFGPFAKKIVYSFHMPLFFFLSGYLLKPEYLHEPFNSYITKYFKRIIIPFVSFWLISYMVWLPTKALRSNAQQYGELTLLDPFIGLIYGVYTKLYVNQVLWFFTCLFCTLLLFYFISKIKANWLILIILIFMGIIGPYIHEKIVFRLPWNVELSLMAIIFFSLGHYCCRSQFLQSIADIKLKMFISAGLVGILFFVVKINGWVNMNRMVFGNLALFYIGAFSGIGFTILLSQMIPKNVIAQWLSINTIVIFPMHLVFFNIFTGTGVILFGLDHDFKNSLAFSILYIVGAILACLPVAYIIRCYVPWMVGKEKRLHADVHAPIPQP